MSHKALEMKAWSEPDVTFLQPQEEGRTRSEFAGHYAELSDTGEHYGASNPC